MTTNLQNRVINVFDKQEPVPNCIKEAFRIKDDQLSRVEVLRILYRYIKEKEMDDPNTRTIRPNRKLRKVLNIDKGYPLSYYNIQSCLCSLYL